jgi:hypothetical protein
MFDVTTRLEVNIVRGKTASTDMASMSNFVIKYRVPTVVVDPQFVEQIMIERQRYRGSYKIICTVDFDNGKNYAMDKLRSIPKAALAVDGFDILVTAGKTDKESLNELKAISEFLKKAVDPLKEIRWTLGMRLRQTNDLLNVMKHLKTYPAAFIRTDHNLVAQNLTLEKHENDVKFIKSHVGTPIKVCGNVDVETIRSLRGKVSRFDVSMTQAARILKKLSEAPVVEPVAEPVVEEEAE